MESSQLRVLYLLDCCCHVALLLPDSVRRRPASALRCKACHQGGSKLWRLALAILQTRIWGLGLLAFECELVPGLHKRFDIYAGIVSTCGARAAESEEAGCTG